MKTTYSLYTRYKDFVQFYKTVEHEIDAMKWEESWPNRFYEANIIPLIFLLLLIGCQSEPKYVSPPPSYQPTLTYFKDGNLCYAATYSRTGDGYIVSSITCVPCDSIRSRLK